LLFTLSIADSTGIMRTQRSSMYLRAELDRVAHVYTLALYRDRIYEVFVDSNLRYRGDIWQDFQLSETDHLVLDNAAVAFVGTELWQVRCGSIFDNIFIGDNLEEARVFSETTWPNTAKETELNLWLKYEEKRINLEAAQRSSIEEKRRRQDEEASDGAQIFF
jgi:hypothetical protein